MQDLKLNYIQMNMYIFFKLDRVKLQCSLPIGDGIGLDKNSKITCHPKNRLTCRCSSFVVILDRLIAVTES